MLSHLTTSLSHTPSTVFRRRVRPIPPHPTSKASKFHRKTPSFSTHISMNSPTDLSVDSITDGLNKQSKLKLEDLNWDHSFVRELPGDPRTNVVPRQVSGSGVSDEDRKASMNSVNPKYILRNYLCQNAIDKAEQGDFEEVRWLLKVMERPYDEQPSMDEYARLPPAWADRPGVRMLSCSS